jgi:hypothetical protein
MSAAKYIVHNGSAYIFPAHVDHAEFARSNRFNHDDIEGAGFVTSGDDELCCYGKSVSLDVKSRGDKDTFVVNRLVKESIW